MVSASALVFAAAIAAPSAYYEVPASGGGSVKAPSPTPALACDPAFPTDIGHAGPTSPGGWPFRAQVDAFNVTQPDDDKAMQLHWVPKDAAASGATSDDIFRNLGAPSPYRPSRDLFPDTMAYQAVPPTCSIKQVHIISRHGSRYPTDGTSQGPGQLAERLQKAKSSGTLQAHGDLAFLQSWEYQLGDSLLTNQGAHDMFQAGSRAYYNYAALLRHQKGKPIIRTTSQRRMLDSARYWAMGFFGWNAAEQVHFEVLDEAKNQNSTLSPKYACPNARDVTFKFGRQMMAEWNAKFVPPITERLQRMLTGYELDDQDTINMMSMCAYETAGMGYSHFCGLFTKEEWEDFEYAADLHFQGDHGFLNPMGKAQGIGWVSEFLARLTNKPFQGPVTSQNRTMDTNTTYFPLDQPIYVDFTHDTVLTSIFTALNLTQLADPLTPAHADPHRTYRTSWVTPFAARFVFEVLTCEDQDYIRMKMNEAIVPLNEDQGCAKPRRDGLCPVRGFVNELKRAYESSRFDLACFGNNGTDFIVQGPARFGTLDQAQIL